MRIKSRRFSLGVSVALMLMGIGIAAPQPSSVIRIKTLLSVDKVLPGGKCLVAVVTELTKGYHIQAHVPSEEFYTPTILTLTSIAGIRSGRVLYAQPKEKKFSFSKNPIAVYEGKVVFGLSLQTDENIAPGKYIVKGKLRYQACDDKICLPPRQDPFELVVEVASRGTSSKAINGEVFSAPPFSDKSKSGS